MPVHLQILDIRHRTFDDIEEVTEDSQVLSEIWRRSDGIHIVQDGLFHTANTLNQYGRHPKEEVMKPTH